MLVGYPWGIYAQQNPRSSDHSNFGNTLHRMQGSLSLRGGHLAVAMI